MVISCSQACSLTVLLLVIKVFHDIAYKAKDRQDLLAGIDEFLDEVIVLPPGEWDPAIRIEPPKSLPSSDKRFGHTDTPVIIIIIIIKCQCVL